MGARKSKDGLVWIARCVLLAFVAQMHTPAMAAPLDLQDPTPRQVEVRFEVSPEDQPGRLDAIWSPPRTAFLESDPERFLVHIRIPTQVIEAHFRATGTDAISGSFSDFVWTLDSRTGHVLSAALTGRVREQISLGPIRTSATIAIRVEMTTENIVGFRRAKKMFGIQTNAFCLPSSEASACVPVAPIRFDPASGYVNAVGSLVAAAAIARIRTFSPLGEARFSETGPDGTENAISGTSHADAVCSDAFNGPCWSDLGGES